MDDGRRNSTFSISKLWNQIAIIDHYLFTFQKVSAGKTVPIKNVRSPAANATTASLRLNRRVMKRTHIIKDLAYSPIIVDVCLLLGTCHLR